MMVSFLPSTHFTLVKLVPLPPYRAALAALPPRLALQPPVSPVAKTEIPPPNYPYHPYMKAVILRSRFWYWKYKAIMKDVPNLHAE